MKSLDGLLDLSEPKSLPSNLSAVLHHNMCMSVGRLDKGPVCVVFGSDFIFDDVVWVLVQFLLKGSKCNKD